MLNIYLMWNLFKRQSSLNIDSLQELAGVLDIELLQELDFILKAWEKGICFTCYIIRARRDRCIWRTEI